MLTVTAPASPTWPRGRAGKELITEFQPARSVTLAAIHSRLKAMQEPQARLVLDIELHGDEAMQRFRRDLASLLPPADGGPGTRGEATDEGEGQLAQTSGGGDEAGSGTAHQVFLPSANWVSSMGTVQGGTGYQHATMYFSGPASEAAAAEAAVQQRFAWCQGARVRMD